MYSVVICMVRTRYYRSHNRLIHPSEMRGIAKHMDRYMNRALKYIISVWRETGLLRDARRLDKRMNIKGWISCTNRQDTPGISLHIFPSKAQNLLTGMKFGRLS